MFQIKTCVVCAKEFVKDSRNSKTQWEKQKYCSWACRAKAVGSLNVGRKHSQESKAKMAESKWGSNNPQFGKKPSPQNVVARIAAIKEKLSGELNYGWKGDAASHSTIHQWLNRHFPRKGVCEHCGRETRWTQYANLKNHNHSHKREHYAELCVSCHSKLDGRRKDPATGRFLSG